MKTVWGRPEFHTPWLFFVLFSWNPASIHKFAVGIGTKQGHSDLRHHLSDGKTRFNLGLGKHAHDNFHFSQLFRSSNKFYKIITLKNGNVLAFTFTHLLLRIMLFKVEQGRKWWRSCRCNLYNKKKSISDLNEISVFGHDKSILHICLFTMKP